MSKPNIIDIVDLAEPVLSEAQLAARAHAEATPVELTVPAILEHAQQMAGLDDFGPMDFVERLQVMLDALNEDRELHPARRHDAWHMFTRYAADRLRIEDMVRRHPEILDIQIDRPIIVAGLPRSGTTHLVSLLSADQRLRSLPWWEAIAPVPTEADAPNSTDPNPRWTRAQQGWEIYEGLLPHMTAMHEFSTDHISEDIELQMLDFSTYTLDWLAHVPRWRDYYLSHDQTGTYAYLKKAMQVLTFLKGPNRWVIKCPQHMEQLVCLKTVFPDGVYVITHRDPVASIQSALTMIGYYDRLNRTRVNLSLRAEYWIDRYRILLERCVAQRDLLPPEQTLDVYFHEWIGDPDACLRRIYATAGLPLTDSALAELHAYIAAHPAGHHGKVVHNLRRDFGLEPEELRQRFQFYFDRFPVRAESR